MTFQPTSNSMLYCFVKGCLGKLCKKKRHNVLAGLDRQGAGGSVGVAAQQPKFGL